MPLALVGLLASLALWKLFKYCSDRWGFDRHPSAWKLLMGHGYWTVRDYGSSYVIECSGGSFICSCIELKLTLYEKQRELVMVVSSDYISKRWSTTVLITG
ncbi:hypothetical protein YC2023_032168 [Brassica napus]